MLGTSNSHCRRRGSGIGLLNCLMCTISSFYTLSEATTTKDAPYFCIANLLGAFTFVISGAVTWKYGLQNMGILMSSLSLISNITFYFDLNIAYLITAMMSMSNLILIQIWIYSANIYYVGSASGALTGIVNASLFIPIAIGKFVHKDGVTLIGGILSIIGIVLSCFTSDEYARRTIMPILIKSSFKSFAVDCAKTPQMICIMIIYTSSFCSFMAHFYDIVDVMKNQDIGFESYITQMSFIIINRFAGGFLVDYAESRRLHIVFISLCCIFSAILHFAFTVPNSDGMSSSMIQRGRTISTLHQGLASLINGAIFAVPFTLNANSFKLGVILASPRFFEILLNEQEQNKHMILGSGMVVSSIIIFLCEHTQRESLPMYIRASKETSLQIKDYVSGLTHDMQTPLAKINMLLDTLNYKNTISYSTITDMRNALFAVSEYRKRYMVHLTMFSDIRDTSTQNIDLPVLLDEISYDMHKIFKRHADIEVQFAEKSVYIQSNLALLRDILTNMYHNAFSHGDGYIRIDIIYTQESCVIKISNSCNKADNADLFKTQRIYNTHGYGLFHIRNLVDILGGQITSYIQNKVCTSILTLKTNTTPIQNQTIELADPLNYAIAIVEDDEFIRTMTRQLIHRHNEWIDCYEFADGESFINWTSVEKRKIIVLLDFQLNNSTLGGIEIAATLAGNPNIILYGLTANDDLTNKALQAGMKAVFPKPITLKILQKILANFDTSKYFRTDEQLHQVGLYEDTIQMEDADLITSLDQKIEKFNKFADNAAFNFHNQLHTISGTLAYINVTKQMQVKNTDKTLLHNIIKAKTDILEMRAAV